MKKHEIGIYGKGRFAASQKKLREGCAPTVNLFSADAAQAVGIMIRAPHWRTNRKGQMMLKILHALLALVLFAGGGQAQTQCASRDQVIATLTDRYGESRQAIGLAANTTVMELFASEAGSWTITITLPNGAVCLLASGENFETLNEALPTKGDPA